MDEEVLWMDHHEWESCFREGVENLIEFIGDEGDERSLWVSPINLVVKTEKKKFRLSFACYGVDEETLEKNIFWIENLNIYIK